MGDVAEHDRSAEIVGELGDGRVEQEAVAQLIHGAVGLDVGLLARSFVVDADADRPMDQLGDRLVLDAAVAELPDDLRTAVVLRDVAHLDYAEIAEALDIPVGTVKSRISRGRSALAERLRLHLDLPLSEEDGNRSHPDERPTELT